MDTTKTQTPLKQTTLDESASADRSGADDTMESTRVSSTPASAKVSTESPQGLLPQDSLSDFQARWEVVQGGFVDDPRAAVRDAQSLVTDMIDQLSDVFTSERESLEAVWKRGDQASTEDLRVAMQRYRAFFDRLLAA